jgi:hypothetical protein
MSAYKVGHKRTEGEIDDNLLALEMARYIALIIHKPNIWKTPFGCIDDKRIWVMFMSTDIAEYWSLDQPAGVMVVFLNIHGNIWVVPSPKPSLDLMACAFEGIPNIVGSVSAQGY